MNNGKYKLTATEAEEKINALFEEREEKNNENPEQARPVIWEEILLALDITKNTWDSWRDYNPDDIPNKNSKEYSVYIDKIYMAELIKKTEARLAMHIQLLGMQNPKLSSYCIWLQKQKHYGGYTDRQEVLTTGDVKISVKLTDDKGKSI